jgi:hypothetical protein
MQGPGSRLQRGRELLPSGAVVEEENLYEQGSVLKKAHIQPEEVLHGNSEPSRQRGL